MIGKIFITRHGYDPQLGKHIKDPYLGDVPSIGACQPKARKKLQENDHIFVISGRVQQAEQFVMAGFAVDRKINAVQAYHEFPEQRLHQRPDGQLDGNVIVTAAGQQHALDDHTNFPNRLENYIVGKNPIALVTDSEIQRGREETMTVLQDILQKKGDRPIDVVTRGGQYLDEEQVIKFRDWLKSLKD